MKIRRIILSTCLLMFVGLSMSACSGDNDDDAPLPGERISILELQRRLEPDDAALEAQGFVSPNAWKNEF